MTDETTQETEVTEEPKVEPKTDAKQDKKGDKKFTDGDVAQIRRTEQKKLTDAQSAWEEEKTTLQSTIDSQNETIQEMVDLLKKDLELDDDYLELLEEKSPMEQLKALRKRAEKASKQDIPRTPKGEGKRNQQFTFQRKNTV